MSDQPAIAVRCTVNGEPARLSVEPRKTLADALREDLGLTGTHVGCEHGVCGACTVLVDGAAVRACLMFAVQADGCEVTTIEGLSPADGSLNPVQQAFRDCHGLQCGFCTPGFVVSVTALLADNPEPTEDEIRDTGWPATSAAAPATRASSPRHDRPRHGTRCAHDAATHPARAAGRVGQGRPLRRPVRAPP